MAELEGRVTEQVATRTRPDTFCQSECIHLKKARVAGHVKLERFTLVTIFKVMPIMCCLMLLILDLLILRLMPALKLELLLMPLYFLDCLYKPVGHLIANLKGLSCETLISTGQ